MGLLLLMGVAACKKSGVAITPLASLNVVNASVNLGTVKANFTGAGQYASATSIGYGANNSYSVRAGITIPFTIVAVADTTQPVFNAMLNLNGGGIYSLYLAGQSGSVDTLLVAETIPLHTDSSCGVRFINLSYNSNPVTVTLSTTPTTAEFSNISYKQSSAFKTYPAGAANGSYIFQVRDGATGNILSTYTLIPPRFLNCTLVLKGMIGGTGANAPGLQRVNNY